MPLKHKIAWIKDLLVQTTQKICRLNQTGNINTYSYTSQFQLLPLHVISPIVTKVSVLSNLSISGCELKDTYYKSFILLFKTIFHRCIGNSVIFKPQRRFLSLVRVTHFTQFEKGILCLKS